MQIKVLLPLHGEVSNLKEVVSNFIKDLNLSAEVNRKIDIMLEDGTLERLLRQRERVFLLMGDSYLRGQYDGVEELYSWGNKLLASFGLQFDNRYLQSPIYKDPNGKFYVIAQYGAGFRLDSPRSFNLLLNELFTTYPEAKDRITDLYIQSGVNDMGVLDADRNESARLIRNMLAECPNLVRRNGIVTTLRMGEFDYAGLNAAYSWLTAQAMSNIGCTTIVDTSKLMHYKSHFAADGAHLDAYLQNQLADAIGVFNPIMYAETTHATAYGNVNEYVRNSGYIVELGTLHFPENVRPSFDSFAKICDLSFAKSRTDKDIYFEVLASATYYGLSGVYEGHFICKIDKDGALSICDFTIDSDNHRYMAYGTTAHYVNTIYLYGGRMYTVPDEFI